MDLYQAILSRRSIRRYRDQALDSELLLMLDDVVSHVRPLIPANRLRVMRRDVVSGEDLIAAMGGYGRVLSPPHYLVGYILGSRLPLVDLGYRMEQIAVQMVQLGVSMCFIGSLNRMENVRVRFRLSQEAHLGAFLIFGYDAESVADRTINAVIRRTSGGATKLTADMIFYDGSFGAPSTPPKELAKLIEAGRRAPSANNAQPWRFLWHDGTLYLFLKRHNNRYGNKPGLQDYRYFDGGTCMSNITMALETLPLSGQWRLLDGVQRALPEHPNTLEPVAALRLD
jgi:hypothetical protein